MNYNFAHSDWHDASIAILKDGNLESLIESERYSHIKHDTLSSECLNEFFKNYETSNFT